MSAAEFGAEDFLRPLCQVRLGLKGGEERQVPSLPAVFCHPAADQLQGWPELSLGKLVHELMKFLARRAHGYILRSAELDDLHARNVPVAGLGASEARIYGRFGYGPATWDSSWRLARGAVRGQAEEGDRCSLELVAAGRPEHEPLRWALADSRQFVVTAVDDHLLLRLVDLCGRVERATLRDRRLARAGCG